MKIFKDDDVRKYCTVGLFLIILYWLFNNMSIVIGGGAYILSIAMPFIVGGVIAFIMNVPMKQIEKLLFRKEKYQKDKFKSIRRVCAYFLTLLLLLCIIVGAMFIVIPQLVSTFGELFQQIPIAAARVQDWIAVQFKEYPQIEDLLNNVSLDWKSLLNSALSIVSEGSKSLISGGIGAVSGIVSTTTEFIIGFVFSIYVLFQKEKLSVQVKKVLYAVFSREHAERILKVADLADNTFEKFLSGQCLEAVILGSMFCITMLIIRLPYAFLVGILISLTALIPIVGAFIGCIVGMFLIALVSPVKAIVFLVMFLVLQQIEGNLIYPHVVGNSVGLPGIWVLAAVSIGGSLMGLVGMLTFIPICSVAYALFRTFINRRLKERNIDL